MKLVSVDRAFKELQNGTFFFQQAEYDINVHSRIIIMHL